MSTGKTMLARGKRTEPQIEKRTGKGIMSKNLPTLQQTKG